MKILAAICLAVLIIGVFVACSKAAPKPNAKSDAQAAHATQVTHVNASQAYAVLTADTDIIVLDVRTPNEFNGGHLEGALNVDFKNPNFATEIAKLDTRKKYLIHCRSGARSRGALKVMKRAGFKNITHMDGGMLGWLKAELPLEK